MLKLIAVLLILAPAAALAQDTPVPADRIDIVVNFKNLQMALAELLADRDRAKAENAALESRLATAMDWLKAAQQPK